ncbi:MAG: hypothetical protein PVH88_24695, partial [Ignavibacteria bacterium]
MRILPKTFITTTILLSSFVGVFAQTGTFDFTDASQTGSTPTTVTQTVDGVTLVVSATANSSDHVYLVNGGDQWSTSANVAYCQWTSATQMVLTFDASVNIGSMRVGEVNSNDYTWVFTPSSGSAKSIAVDGGDGATVDFGTDFVGITSITITNQTGGNINPVVDNIEMDVSLPVELTFFNVLQLGSDVKLLWQTATEVNNYGFQVERLKIKDKSKETTSSQSWKNVGFVNGNGNSNSPKSYSYTDIPTGGATFKYRLKQIDFDGAYEYSDEVEVTLDAITEYSLEQNYPNPFNPT